MGALLCLVDFALFFAFLMGAVAVPLIYAQTCLPSASFPEALVDVKKLYVRECGDYLVSEKPRFFVGIVWLKIGLQWPLALVNLYAVSARKSWFGTTCLMYGVSCLSAMAAILGEVVGSDRTSEKMLMVYYTFTGISILATLRGLVPHPGRVTTMGKRPMVGRKKKA